jgi:hypothetical protein
MSDKSDLDCPSLDETHRELAATLEGRAADNLHGWNRGGNVGSRHSCVSRTPEPQPGPSRFHIGPVQQGIFGHWGKHPHA